MKLSDLYIGEKFRYNNQLFTKGKKIGRTKGYDGVTPDRNHRIYPKENPYDIFDCFDQDGKHRPFREDTDVSPLQRRIDIDGI